MTLRDKLQSTTPPSIRTGGTADTGAKATYGTVTATIILDAFDVGEVKLDGAQWTSQTSGIISDLVDIEARHGAVAARDAAIALCKVIASTYNVVLK